MKNLLISTFIFFNFFFNYAFASSIKYNIGLSYLYANINDANFDFVNKYESITNPKDQLKSISFGISKFYDNNFNWSLNTNRLHNRQVRRKVRRKSDGVLFENGTKTTIDSLILSYKIKRYNLGLILANIQMSKSLYYRDSLVSYNNKNTILGGLNIAYFVSKNFVPSVSYILPNKELDLEGAVSLNINYLF